MINNLFANNNNNQQNLFQSTNNQNNNGNIFNRSSQNIFQSQNNNGQVNIFNNNNNNQGGYQQQSQNIFQQNNNMNTNTNIFGNNSNNNMNNNNNYGGAQNNIFNNNNQNMYQNNNNISALIGSQRGKYELTKSHHTDTQQNNGGAATTIMNTSIIFCKGFEKMNPLLVRLEDYYLIRTGKLSDAEKQKITSTIQMNSFNQNLITSIPQNFQPPNTQALNKDIRMVQSQYLGNNNNNNINIFNNNNNNGNNSNLFSNNNNNNNNNLNNSVSRNIFNNNNNNNGNIFNNNNNNNMNNNGGNIFANNNNQNNNVSNIFSFNNSQNNNMNKSNIFNNGNNTNNNTTNIFQNNNGNMGNNSIFQGNNNNNNIFRNDNSTNNSNLNIFSNNNNNINNSIFRGNNNNSSNIFNNNNNNGGNNASNIFNNNGGNSNVNIFRSNNNNNGGSIFSNNNNNSVQNIFQKNNPSIFNNTNNNNGGSIFNNNGGSIFNNNSSIFGPNIQGGSIFQNNNNNNMNNFNNGNIFANYNNPQMYQSNLPGPANGYYSIQSGMYYAPTIQTGDLTRQQYLDLLEQEAEDKKVVRQSYFMPSYCPEEYAPAFRKKPIFKPFYVTVQEEKGIRKLAKSLLPLQETIAKTQRGHSSETSNAKNDSFQLTQSAIKQRKQMEEFNFYKQPAQETKGREMYARQQLSHINPVGIKVEVLCSTLEGDEEEITLENQIDTLSKMKQIGLYCKDHLLKMGKMKEDSRPYSFQIYYDGNLIRNQELQASDVFPVKLEPTYQCEVIFLYDRYPFMNTSDYIISPPLEELQTYSLKELKNVHNFSVEGNFGKLEWQEPVDLTDLDIDKTIYIRDQQIQVYPEVEYASKYKPKVGEGINNKCMITYKNASSIQRKIKSGELNLQTVIKCIKKQSDEQNVQFVKFDQKNLTWTILVDHFSGYQFNLDEQDDDDNKDEQDSSANIQNASSNSNSRSNQTKQQQLSQGQQQFNQDSQRTANQQLQQIQLQAENQFQQKISGSTQQLPMRQNFQNSNQFKQMQSQNEQYPSETQRNMKQMRGQQNNNKSQENSFIQQDYQITSHQQQSNNYQMNENTQYQNQPNYIHRNQLQQQQYYGNHIDPANDIIMEEVENGSYNNTQADIDTLKSQAQEIIEPNYQLPKTSYQQFLLQQNNEDQFTNMQNKQRPLNNFKDFKARVEQRKNKIFQKEQQVPKSGVLYQSVKKHEIVARGIQTLNQCLYQHSVQEFTFKGKKFYNDFSFCPSWNQNSYISYSSSLKAIKKHTILPNNMGRIKSKDKQRDQVEKYNNIVINGFLQSIIDSQATNVIENIEQITKLYTKDQGMSDTQIWSTLPQIKIPTDNQYSLFLIIYIKNYLLPVLNASKNNLMQSDLYQSLKEELSILIMVNILFGNPQIDVISILKKVNKNSFSENQWKILFEGLRNNKMDLSENVVHNLRKRQLKKYFEWKYSENKGQFNEQRTFIDRKEMKTQEEVEDQIIQCLKSHQIQNAIQIADSYKLHTISHLLTTFEQGSVENQIKLLNQDKYQSFNRIVNFISGNLEELYKQNQRNEISILNKFACELWYQKNQRLSLSQTFDQFVQKIDKQIYDVDQKQQIISLEILLLSLYAQHHQGENQASKQLVNINLFAQINSQCYSQNKLDKRLGWFIIEFMNSVYFSSDKVLLKDKRARLMRGFLQQLQILKKWKYEIVVLIIMKDILRLSQFISSVKNTFLRNCIPKISQEDKSEAGQPSNLNNKFLIQTSNRDSSSDNSLEINKSFQIDSENSSSVECLLYLIYTQYFHQSIGLYYYYSQIYQSALYHFMRDPNLAYLDISNKILAYYEGPRIYLFGEQNERQEIEKYVEQIAKKAHLIFKYKYQSGLIKEVFSLLQGNNQNQYKQEYINSIINLKDLLLETQNVLNLVVYPHQYQVIVDNQEVQSKNRRLQSKADDSVTTLDNGGMLFQEFISFIFQQLAEKVPDIRRYSQHYQTSGDIQQLLEIVSEHKAPKNEQIKHLILSTLKQNYYM